MVCLAGHDTESSLFVFESWSVVSTGDSRLEGPQDHERNNPRQISFGKSDRMTTMRSRNRYSDVHEVSMGQVQWRPTKKMSMPLSTLKKKDLAVELCSFKLCILPAVFSSFCRIAAPDTVGMRSHKSALCVKEVTICRHAVTYQPYDSLGPFLWYMGTADVRFFGQMRRMKTPVLRSASLLAALWTRMLIGITGRKLLLEYLPIGRRFRGGSGLCTLNGTIIVHFEC